MKKKGIKALRIGVTVLSLAGVVWFLLPLIKGGFGEGVIFGELCCLTALFLGNFYGKFQKKAVKIIMGVLLVCFLVGLSWVGFLTVKINTATHSPEIPPGTTAIVLGARVYDDRPSLSLKGRLDVAVDYLKNDPTARCIVSGGQGADESRSEAAVEKEYLLALGIGSDRIFMEDRSTSTKENMAFSKEIAKRENLGTDLVIATQGFHQYRAGELAKGAGFTPYAIVAHTDPLLYPAYYAREILSLTKFYGEKLIGRQP